MLINQKKELVIDFAIPADHSVEMKESEKIDKYLNFAKELEKKRGEENESDGDNN